MVPSDVAVCTGTTCSDFYINGTQVCSTSTLTTPKDAKDPARTPDTENPTGVCKDNVAANDLWDVDGDTKAATTAFTTASSKTTFVYSFKRTLVKTEGDTTSEDIAIDTAASMRYIYAIGDGYTSGSDFGKCNRNDFVDAQT